MRSPNVKSLLTREMTRREFMRVIAVMAISAFGIVGLIKELESRAASPYEANEAENGTLGGTAAVAANTNTAGDNVVVFGAATAMAAPIAPAIPTQPAVIPPTSAAFAFPVGNNNVPAVPSWLVTLEGPRFHNVFYVGEAITLSMGKSGATAWKATDIDGNSSTGSIASSATSFTVTKPTATPASAWLEVIVTGPNNDPNYGNIYGETSVHIWNNVSSIQTAPPWNDSMAGPTDQSWNGMVDALVNFGPQRFNIEDAASPASDVTNILAVLQYDAGYWSGHGSANRPRANFCSFPNGATTSAELAGVTSAVKSLYPTVEWFEGPSNEPQDTSYATIASQMVAFAAAVRAGNPNAKVMGPSCVTFNVSQQAWLTSFLKALPSGTMDGLSVHGYNTSDGDLAMTENTLSGLQTVLANTGHTGMTVFMTEGCGEFSDVYGVMHWRRSAHWIGLRYLAYEAYGIPREQQSYFYPDSNGNWGFPTFLWAANDNADAPIIDLLRGLQERTYNATFTRRLDFGTPGQFMFLGSIYTSPTDQCVVLMSGGSPSGTVTLAVGSGQLVTVYDWLGNASAQVADANGHVVIAVNDLATYVSCAPSATISLVDADNGLLSAGSDLAATAKFSASVATASSSYDSSTPSALTSLNNGQFEYGFYNSSGGEQGTLGPIQWQANGPPPVWVLGQWTTVQTINRIIISTAPPWQGQCGLVEFTVSTWNGTTWVVQYSFNDLQALSTAFVRPTNSWGSLLETFWKEQCLWDIVLPSTIETNGILITVTKTSYGGEPDEASGNNRGTNYIGQGGPTVVNLREIMVYGPTT